MDSAESVDGQKFDVVIIGAGVAGAMTGVLASRAGLRTLLVDRHRFPRHKVCGCCLNARAIRILKQASLESALQGLHPVTTSSLSIRYRGQVLDVAMPAGAAVSRRILDQWLVDEAVASGCRFIDGVTASVLPLPCDATIGFDVESAAVAEDSSPERSIELRVTGMREREPEQGGSSEYSGGCPSQVFAKIAVICDGLGHPSLHQLASFKAPTGKKSRIGLGAVFPRDAADVWIRKGEILMAVAAHGYAGVVEIEDDQLNLAAAIDPVHISHSRSPLISLQSIFDSAGVPVPAGLRLAAIKGTVPLTRTARRIAGHRLFLLGDAAGYIEPFTGEGMAWALTAAASIVPLSVAVVRDGWSAEVETLWQSTFRRIVRREQTTCRILSATIRRPWLLTPFLAACQLFPSLTRRLACRINNLPEVLESTP